MVTASQFVQFLCHDGLVQIVPRWSVHVFQKINSTSQKSDIPEVSEDTEEKKRNTVVPNFHPRISGEFLRKNSIHEHV